MKRVLVVEDDPDIVELISHYLQGEGFNIEALGNGEEALRRLRGDGFDLLILDLQLPGMDSLSLCAALRRDPRTEGLPIIMLTARGDESDRIVGLEVGADDYVVKPFISSGGEAAGAERFPNRVGFGRCQEANP